MGKCDTVIVPRYDYYNNFRAFHPTHVVMTNSNFFFAHKFAFLACSFLSLRGTFCVCYVGIRYGLDGLHVKFRWNLICIACISLRGLSIYSEPKEFIPCGICARYRHCSNCLRLQIPFVHHPLLSLPLFGVSSRRYTR